MRQHLLFTLAALVMNPVLFAQTNTFPPTGNVGIGTTTPLKLLHVKGAGAFGKYITSANATRVLNLADDNAVLRIIRVHATNAPAVELLSRTSADGPNVAYWDMYTEPSDASFRIRDRIGGGAGLDRLVVTNTGLVGIGTTTPAQKLQVVGSVDFSGDVYLHGTRFLSSGPSTAGGNTLVGESSGTALFSGVNNSAFGSSALSNNTSGAYNSAFGLQALGQNNGSNNTAIGALAMSQSTAASLNTAIGVLSLGFTRTSQYNTAVGLKAGANHDNGWNNVFVGANADVIESGFFNVIAIGQGTLCTAPSQVTIGNPSTTAYRAYTGWSNISDGRFKADVQEGVPGLSFINKLRPVTYRLKASALDAFLNNNLAADNELSAESKAVTANALKKKETYVQSGFVTQEVEQAARELGYAFSGVELPNNDRDVFALRYSEFVVPLVKAVQELDAKTQRIEELEKKHTDLEKQLAELRQMLVELRKERITTASPGSSFLETALPNPAHNSTTIRYSIPEGTASARLTLTNSYGQLLRQFSLTTRGEGQLNLNTASLPSGVYTYTLWIDGREAASKGLVVAK